MSLIVVNFDAAPLVRRLLDGVVAVVDEVIVVDNSASATPLDVALAGHGESVQVVRPGRNLGYGAAANRGAAVARGDVLIVCNPDIEIDPADLTRLVRAAASPGVGLAAPRFQFPDGMLQRSAHRAEPGLVTTLYELCYPFAALLNRVRPGWHPTLFSVPDHDRDLDAVHVLGAFMAISRDAFERVHGFDESFFLYREETDLCRRLGDHGFGIRHVAGARAVHAHGGSSGPAMPTQARAPYLRSHYHYLRKHRGPLVALAAWAVGTIGAAVWLVTGRGRDHAWLALRWHLLHPGGGGVVERRR